MPDPYVTVADNQSLINVLRGQRGKRGTDRGICGKCRSKQAFHYESFQPSHGKLPEQVRINWIWSRPWQNLLFGNQRPAHDSRTPPERPGQYCRLIDLQTVVAVEVAHVEHIRGCW